jgi:hypothetical protein
LFAKGVDRFVFLVAFHVILAIFERAKGARKRRFRTLLVPIFVLVISTATASMAAADTTGAAAAAAERTAAAAAAAAESIGDSTDGTFRGHLLELHRKATFSIVSIVVVVVFFAGSGVRELRCHGVQIDLSVADFAAAAHLYL